jgi:hypothetical protein
MEKTMKKRTTLRSLAVVAGLALSIAPLSAQTANFTKYVSLGDSYGAGYSASCLVDRNQKFSFPATLAKQFGLATFQQPTVSDPGIGASASGTPQSCTGLKSLSPLTFGPISAKLGSPTNLALATPYDNLAVPGYKIADVSDKLTDKGGAADLVLRGKGSALNQALSLNPTFVTLSILVNDIAGAGLAGFMLDNVTVTPLAAFTAKYNSVAGSLKANGRTGVFLSMPDLRLTPLVSTLPPVVLDPSTNKPLLINGQTVPLLGPGNAKYPCPAGVAACPLPAGTLVTLVANAPLDALGKKSFLGLGFGIPCAVAPVAQFPQCGKPLPDGSFDAATNTANVGVLFYPDEVDAIDQRIRDMNAAIKAAATANGFQYFDLYALSQDIMANGRDFGGIHISKDFVTGGLFAYGDPVHLSNIGYTILADELIQFINSAYGTSVPRPDMSVALFTPDVPAAGTTGIGVGVDTSIFFTEESWRALFEEFPLQDPSIKLALPADEMVPDRAPIILPGRRSARD